MLPQNLPKISNHDIRFGDPVSLHRLPFQLMYNGPAQVSSFYEPKPIPFSKLRELNSSYPMDQLASFRGKYMHGMNVCVPDGHMVFREQGRPLCDVDHHRATFRTSSFQGPTPQCPHNCKSNSSGVQQTERVWNVHRSFSSFKSWNRSPFQLGFPKESNWLNWMQSIGPSIHAPVCMSNALLPFESTIGSMMRAFDNQASQLLDAFICPMGLTDGAGTASSQFSHPAGDDLAVFTIISSSDAPNLNRSADYKIKDRNVEVSNVTEENAQLPSESSRRKRAKRESTPSLDDENLESGDCKKRHCKQSFFDRSRR
ncbi:uncharacterized protein LOC126325827 isoform X2 [Schistocerca gregaria]|uniref:uncharacterized protein LOC126325827 isoform X2 n=1 Tax=Schistocerca gregaria TaxID=7010 RepID=UPI00211DC70F|nr:uncharacterized protein LOC126325827 isoform X2 [Schistocerca gregaria]